MKYLDASQLIGNTPLVQINKVRYAEGANVWVKIEKNNPGGSIKDRAALSMIESAEQQGILTNGTTLIEPTSGNTGIALAMIAAIKGYKMVLTMPSSMSKERMAILRAYGAELILTDPKLGMSGAITIAQQLVEQKGYVMLSQFENIANPLSHYATTAQELIHDLGKIDYFIAGVGTGGTISGIGQRLKETEKTYVIALEPENSTILQGGSHSPHKIQGIGAGFIPKNFNAQWVDEVRSVSEENAFRMMKELAQKEGLLVGISSAANIYAAIELAKDLPSETTVVTVAPDGGERYLSLELF